MKEMDPVCKMEVSPEKAPKENYKGKDYYFCSEECKMDFVKNPEKFVQAQ